MVIDHSPLMEEHRSCLLLLTFGQVRCSGLIGLWQIKQAVDGSNLRARENKMTPNFGNADVLMSHLEDFWTRWVIEEWADRNSNLKVQ